MYTQCFHCETVFQLTADTLRAAGGKVRCGRCGEVFNALARLAEDASAFWTPGEGSPSESTPGDGSPHESTPHESTPHESTPHESTPHESTHGEGPRHEWPPGAWSPRESTPHESTPHESTPHESTPHESTPHESTPHESTHGEGPRHEWPPGEWSPRESTPGDGSPHEEPPHESALEMEARADEILRSPAPNRPAAREPPFDGEDFASGDVEVAHLQLIDNFTPWRPETPASPRHLAPTVAAPVPPESAYDDAFEFTLPSGELDRVFVDPTAARARPSSLADAAATAPIAQPADQLGESVAERVDGLHVAEHVRRDVLAGLRDQQVEEPRKPAYPAMRLAWGGAAAVLALALLGQMIRENRAWLAAIGPLRGPLHSVYEALGVKVQPPVNLSAYQLRQWGVTGDPSVAGTLRVRASILNTSALLQPYPLLRVTLANRFGTHVGARDFEPGEYLGRPTQRLMTPGERADATLDIHDPGTDAEGFEIDLCLRGPERMIACAADAATQADVPRADVPRADAPRTDVPHADMPHADMPHADMPHADVPHADVPRADAARGKP